jgi:hypothetical protein
MSSVLLDLRSWCEGVPLVNPGNIAQAQRKFCGFGQLKFDKARFQEKPLSTIKRKPYRKPTQVIGSRRPRRTSECSSRNSAKQRP